MSASSQGDSLKELTASWQNSPFPSVKIASYFPVYVQLFDHLRGGDCTFIETGILDGGSLFMWRSWLGEKARIVGIDLNPEASKWRDHGFEIYIGDQGDPSFWKSTLARIGNFDALLDDGGHQSFQQIVTAHEAIRFARNRCVIAVEDTATSFMSDFANHGKRSFLEFSKAATDCITARSFDLFPGRLPAEYNKASVAHFRDVFSIQFFSGIVAFHVDPTGCIPPNVIRNMDRNSASDFRYEGRNMAVIDWPGALSEESVVVRGGANRITRLQKAKNLIRRLFRPPTNGR